LLFDVRRTFPDEDSCYLSNTPRPWIKLQRCSAAFSYAGAYGNANSNADAYGNANSNADPSDNAHTGCHSAPAVWPAHFTLILGRRPQLLSKISNCYPSAARVAAF
jgi:hypothetical protein